MSRTGRKGSGFSVKGRIWSVGCLNLSNSDNSGRKENADARKDIGGGGGVQVEVEERMMMRRRGVGHERLVDWVFM